MGIRAPGYCLMDFPSSNQKKHLSQQCIQVMIQSNMSFLIFVGFYIFGHNAMISPYNCLK